MKSPSLSTKLALVVGVLSAVAGWLLLLLLSEQAKSISTARCEIAGVQYLRTLRPILQMEDPSTLSAAALQLRLSELETVQNETGLGSDLSFSLLQRALSDTKIPSAERNRRIRRHGAELWVQVGDNSNLILDPNLDSYYTMDTVLLSLPRERRHLEMLKSLYEGERANPGRTQPILALLKEASDGFNHSLNQAVASDQSQTLARANVQVRAGRAPIEKLLALRNTAPSVALVDAALSSNDDQWIRLSNALESILQLRVTELEATRAHVLLMVIVGWFCAFMASIGLTSFIGRNARTLANRLEALRAQDVTALQNAILALSEGDDSKGVCPVASVAPLLEVGTRDELGELSRTVNNLAGQTLETIIAFENTRLTLAAANQALTDSEQAFKTLVGALGEGILIIGDDGYASYANSRFCEISGFQFEELKAVNLEAIFGGGSWSDACREAHDLESGGKGEGVEAELTRKDGSKGWVLLNATRISSNVGDLNGTLVAVLDISLRKSFEQDLRRQAFHDPLTGLANRALFHDRLEHAIERTRRTGVRCCVYFLDFDNFKVVNDSLGHSFGDELLVRAAQRLKKIARPYDTVARLGGDEFTILVEDVRDDEMVLAIADRIVAMLSIPMELSGHEIHCSVSVGVAVAQPDQRSEDLIKNADIAMYRAKDQGKNRYVLFDEEMRKQAEARLLIENELRQALLNSELEVFYQPIIDMASGKVCEVEALARWFHKERGAIPPSVFIPVAEDAGLIESLGSSILRIACAWGGAWNMRHPEEKLSISVNLSTIQLQSSEVVATVEQILAETELAPADLKLEITESMLMANPEKAISRLHEFKKLGIQLAIDDFGTGYSSMAYLRMMPIDTLKIDRSFVSRIDQTMEDNTILAAIMQLAQSLGLKVTSEGIETEDQRRHLKSLGSHKGQGYLFSPPVSASKIEGLIEGGFGDTTKAA